MALLEITERNAPIISLLNELAIPLDSISREPTLRTSQIEVAGFPLGLGAVGEVSPLAIVGNIASDEIETENQWGREPIIFCSPAIAQGTSGGPAFLANSLPQQAIVAGMYIGVVSDVSGAKLSKLVPGRVIRQHIESLLPKLAEQGH